jgi:hypothetical protein
MAGRLIFLSILRASSLVAAVFSKKLPGEQTCPSALL